MEDIILELKKRLKASVRKNRAEGMLFSGGLDTTILASINPKIRAISVNFNSRGEDIIYSATAARYLNMERHEKSVTTDEAINAIPEVIGILKTFDPAIPNDIVVYLGLKKAKELGIKSISTGDASDELFGGYSYMQVIRDLDAYIRRIAQNMNFSSGPLAKHFCIKLRQPFMDKKVIELALSIAPELKIKAEGDRVHGKWILRKAYEESLPEELLWQSKRPLECGSGMTELRKIIPSTISDTEFADNPYPVKFMNKEHFFYYKVYRDVVGDIPTAGRGQEACPYCSAGMAIASFHCRTCGYAKDIT